MYTCYKQDIHQRDCCLYLGVQMVPACLLCLEVPLYLGVLFGPVVQAHPSHPGALVDQVALYKIDIEEPLNIILNMCLLPFYLKGFL